MRNSESKTTKLIYAKRSLSYADLFLKKIVYIFCKTARRPKMADLSEWIIERFLWKKNIFRFFQTIVRDEPDVIEGTPDDISVTISQLILEAHQAFVITNQDIEKLRWDMKKQSVLYLKCWIKRPTDRDFVDTSFRSSNLVHYF